MLRIQKAVLKAKDTEKHKTIQVSNATRSSQSPLEGLKYSQTRVAEVHPDTLEDKRVIASFANNDSSQIFKALRTQVIQKMRENDWRSLAITSPSENEGKSLIAANLAVAIAMEVNQTVLLVDLDLRNPSLGQYFGIEQEHGLLSYLRGQVALEEIMVNPGVDRLVVVPGKGTSLNSSEIISSPKMVSLFKETRTRYKQRLVIYDMPPVLRSDDVLSCIGHIDAALMVLEDGRNDEKDIVKAVRQMQKTKLLGTVINRYHKGGWLL